MPWRRARLGVRGSRGRPAAPPQAVLPARGRRAVCGPGPSRRPGALSLGALQAPAPRSYAASRGALLGRAPACRRGLPRGPARRAGTSPPGAAASGAARGEVAGRLRRGRALGSAGVGEVVPRSWAEASSRGGGFCSPSCPSPSPAADSVRSGRWVRLRREGVPGLRLPVRARRGEREGRVCSRAVAASPARERSWELPSVRGGLARGSCGRRLGVS